MLSDSRYTPSDIASAIEFLKASSSRSFRADTLDKAVRFFGETDDGSANATGWASGRPVLLVARGPGAGQHRDGLLRFIKRVDPVVIALNRFVAVPDEVVTAWAACHPIRLSMELGLYRGVTRPLIAPFSAIPQRFRAELGNVKVFDFGIRLVDDEFAFRTGGCTVPKPLVAAYACAFANSAGAPHIFLAGFDGYPLGDPRHAEMAEIFKIYQRTPGAVPLTAITPTNYPVPTASVYDTRIGR
jgi:4-hydroxy 2-oxovalerate aldolase